MDRKNRIEAAEAALNSARVGVDTFARALDAFDASQAQVAEVSDYLGSEDWFDDREAYDRDESLQEVPAGILSEDLGYDLLVDNRDIAIRMLEIATKVLKEL